MNTSDKKPLTLSSTGSVKLCIETLILLALAIGFWVYSYNFAGEDPLFRWGPEFWPRLFATILGCLALLQFAVRIREFRASSATEKEFTAQTKLDGDETAFLDTIQRSQIFRVLLTIFIPVCFLWFMARVGFLIAAPFFIIAMMLLFGVRRKLHLTFTALVIYVVFVLVFIKILGVPLPTGNWPAFHSLNINIRSALGM